MSAEYSLRQVIASIQAEILQGEYHRAATLAQEHESDFAGIPEFDFVGGIALMHADNPERASRFFERATIVRPEDNRARFEFARSLFAIGDYDLARDNFTAVVERDPPPQLADRAQRFVDAIDRRAAAQLAQLMMWVEGRVGYDENVLSASDSIIEGNIGNLQHGLVNLRLYEYEDSGASDSFAEIATGGLYRTPWVANSQWRLNGQLQHRGHYDWDIFDQTLLQLGGSRVWRQSHEQEIHLTSDIQHIRLDNDHLFSRLRIAPQYRRMIGPGAQARVQPEIAYNAYELDDRDSVLARVNASVMGALSKRLVMIGSAGMGYEDAEANIHSRYTLEAGVGFQYLIDEGRLFAVNGTLQRQHYHSGVDVDENDVSTVLAYLDDSSIELDSTQRELLSRGLNDSAEKSLLRRVTASYIFTFPATPWRLTLTYSHTDKSSNIDSRQFDRDQYFVGLRYDWN
ncbi:hypothetical protein LRD18_07800 [Halorhodospira halochloris]|uniref:tetratricopeptide repeat protein n=1 Tax=Halorhodospira halochloris TaxID=1052 RepID=UPI001EE93879|nr:hypothetical protein [Halorhodospira halochloris]MCG5530778.1 hypothetical protein [Halorhodospira halochloris]